MSDTQGRDNVSYADAALDPNGKIARCGDLCQPWRISLQYGPFIPTEAGTHMLSGVYDIPVICVNVKGR